MAVDYSLYLVTDSTPAILGDADLCTVVEEALKGGVTVVQYRDKTSDTGVLVATAKKLHAITQRYNVPLIINDRVDVALACGAEGVHLGQDDMAITTAKQLLKKDAIIGISASSVEEAVTAVENGADYLGIGTTFATPTKTNTKSIIGTAGLQKILTSLSSLNRSVPTVAIGGINPSNVQRVLYQSAAPQKHLDGVAIVSAIMAAKDPASAAKELKNLITTPPSFGLNALTPRTDETGLLLEGIPGIVQKVATTHPLVHNMINFVVVNFVANVALAAGVAPIMSPYGDEAKDLAVHNGALLINMGTLTSSSIPEYLKALTAYNINGNPVVLDPVGVGATQIRRDAVKALLAGGYFTLIKGNEREIKEVFQRSADGESQRGVDSGPTTMSERAKGQLVRDLARRERNVVLLTGAVDYLSDGNRVIAVENGHEILGRATGTGCAIGTICGAYLVAYPEDKLLAVLAGLVMYEVAAENAAANQDKVRGSGSFVPAFIDEIDIIRGMAESGDSSWFEGRAKIRVIDVDA